MFRTLDRYLVREIALPFVISLTVLTFILEIPPILLQAEDLIAKGVEWATVARVLLTLLPQALGLTIPMSVLLGILIGFGRLSSDREFVAIQACGVSLIRLARPVLLVAALATAATAYEMIVALPNANQTFREIVFVTMAQSVEQNVKPRVFYDVGYIDTTGQIYGPAKGSFLDEMLEMLGVDVITGDPVTYEVPLETLIERDPQVIILGINAFYQPTPAIVAKRTGWSALSAVKSGDIRSVTDTEITRPGPRLATGMRNLALTMYPNLALPSAAPSVAPTASP